jgi:hypothetical protein
MRIDVHYYLYNYLDYLCSLNQTYKKPGNLLWAITNSGLIFQVVTEYWSRSNKNSVCQGVRSLSCTKTTCTRWNSTSGPSGMRHRFIDAASPQTLTFVNPILFDSVVNFIHISMFRNMHFKDDNKVVYEQNAKMQGYDFAKSVLVR